MALASSSSRRFSLFGIGATPSSSPPSSTDPPRPQLKLEADRRVYRPGDPITVTIEIKNPTEDKWTLLIEKLTFECKGIEKLDAQWFSASRNTAPDSKHRRDVVRTVLPNGIPPSYRGTTIRYLYYVRSTLSGQYLILENGPSHRESVQQISDLEARVPLQIWVTQKNNGLVSEENSDDGIVPLETAFLDVYWKEMDADSEWAKLNEALDGVEDGYESSRDDILSVSSYNPSKEDINRTFGSSLSLASMSARSSKKGSFYATKERTSLPSNMAFSRLSVAENANDTASDRSTAGGSGSQPTRHLRSFSADDDSRLPSPSESIEPGGSEGFLRGRSYNIRLDDQVLLRFSPKNSESTYFFSDMIGGTLTFLHEGGARRCLELSITLETKETINRRFVHPSRRHSPTITKIHSDHQEVVADLVQTSFLFSIPIDGPMSFSTRYVSVQWALRFEFLTTPKNIDWTRFEHPLLIEGRDKCEWTLPIMVHAPPLGAVAAAQSRNEKLFSLDPLWIRT